MTPDRPAMFRAGQVSGAAQPMMLPEASGARILLADVSEFQPQIADALYLAWSKAVVIRALYGDAHDDRAWYGGDRRNLLHAGGAKFLGIYQYLVASQDGAAQARAFHSLVGAIQPGEVLIADFEEGTHAVLTAWYNEMLRLYGQAIRPYLWTYTGLNFGTAQGALPVEWIAAYQASEPVSPHKLWQFTDRYDVPGVGRADCSVFHGTIDELAALAYQPAIPQPKPPADWTYGAPRNLKAAGGHTSVRLTWDMPAGAPEPPAEYHVYVYRGTVCDRATIVPSYPRTVATASFEGGSLERGRTYTAHVVASGPGGARERPYCFASVTFTTG